MRRSFIFWLDNYLDDKDSSTVVGSVVGLMSFTVLLGVILGNIAVKLGLLAGAILVVLSFMLILLRDRKRLKREIDSRGELLTGYCDQLYDESQSIALVKDWNQITTIDKDGDVSELITIQAVALQDYLYFLRFRTDPKWVQPHRYRRRVHVDFRSINGAGDRGPSWQVTPSWLPDGRLEMLAHLHSPIPMGTEIKIEIERRWPGKCAPLIKEGAPENFAFYFSHALQIEHAKYVVVLPEDVEAYYEPIGFRQPNPDFSVQGGKNQDGRFEVALAVDNLPADTRIGMRLQRKNVK